jgi:GR25 family glycosyltransferase involved in LPS biosynthesis
VALGQVFSENFGFPCQSTFHLLLYNHAMFKGVVNTNVTFNFNAIDIKRKVDSKTLNKNPLNSSNNYEQSLLQRAMKTYGSNTRGYVCSSQIKWFFIKRTHFDIKSDRLMQRKMLKLPKLLLLHTKLKYFRLKKTE